MQEDTSFTEEMIDLLNQVLQIEYSMIVNYPRLTSHLENEATRDKALQLGQDSIRHADIVSNIITELGGEPNWSFTTIDQETPLSELFSEQFGAEKLAYDSYKKCAGLSSDTVLQDQLRSIAEEEKEHMQLVEDILAELG